MTIKEISEQLERSYIKISEVKVCTFYDIKLEQGGCVRIDHSGKVSVTGKDERIKQISDILGIDFVGKKD